MDSQKLLNEVAAAKLCLLDPSKRAEYDASLREKQAARENEAVEADVFTSLAEAAADGRFGVGQKASRPKPNVVLIGSSAAAVAVVLIAAWVFLSGGTGVSPVLEPSTGKMPVAPALPSDAGEKQSTTGETESPPSPPANATLPESPPQKAGNPDSPKGNEPAAAAAQPAPPAPAPAKTADAPVTPPAPVQPPPGPASPAPTEETKKHPIPSADIQRDVGGTIEETYKISEAKTPEAKLKLAKELSEAAQKSAKPDEQYVLLRKAVDLACDGGDAALMLEMLGPLTDSFTIDPLVAKAAMLERFTKGPRSPARVQSLVEGSRGVIDDAMSEDRYEIASTLARTVADACSRSTPQVRKEAADRRKRVQQVQTQFEEVQKALEVLKAKPEDAEANLAAGSWYCFVKDDWRTGLPHLAKGSDALLKSQAQRELSLPPGTPEDQLKLADAWWDGAAERRGEEKAAMLRCAGHWYEQAIGKLDGINKTKAEKRLAQIAELAQESPSRPGRDPLPAIAPFDAKRARGCQIQWSRYLKVPLEFTNSIGMKFVLIPPGEFDMGSAQQEVERLISQAKQRNLSQYYTERLPFEAPRHRVRLTQAFYLGRYEVTQAQYQQVMGSNPSTFKESGADAPVEMVSWNDAVTFCQRLSAMPAEKIAGGVYRLPSEAEWEYAARAGTTTAWCFGDEEAAFSEYAWWASNSPGKTRPVGERRPNGVLLFDMHGSVFEWCADWFFAEYYAKCPTSAPVGPDSGASRVVRGGSWHTIYPEACRCAWRNYNDPGDRVSDYGFRVARGLPAQTTSPRQPKRPASTASTHSSAGSRGLAPPPAVAPFSTEQARKHQEPWAKHLKVPVEQTNSIGMKFILIPPGRQPP
jgi:formylglycine-generating enzyme required for sulfatase activity